MMRFLVCALAAFFPFFIFALPASALSPDEVLVIANRNAAKSIGLAGWYMEKRHIPKENLLPLFVTDKETCSRETYLKKNSSPGPPRFGREPEAQRHCNHVRASSKN